MRAALAAACVSAVVLFTATPARAEGGPFGLGLILGSPTGVSMKLYFNKKNAIDAEVGASFISQNGLHIHADYLWHPVMLTEESSFFMPLYVGLGFRIMQHDRGNAGSDTHLGVRFPVGVLFDFRSIPIDVFIEVALVLDFVQTHGNDSNQIVDVNAGVGVRYYF